MAMCDYYLCDVCQKKAIYDADIYDRWDYAGDMRIICKSCAETYKCTVVPKDAAPPRPTQEMDHEG